MEEDVGAKAPVTRLRRRLSVEQSEEVKSPSAPSTPSKKRGGRLAAKPQLELIDENSTDNTPRKTNKNVKDAIEATEEKVLTPARRSTRIKSNTSILSDTPQTFDSPRAKRAARRNSQIGSDNEGPVTPARQTRRTRKDSTTSVDKQGSDYEAPVTPARQTRRMRKDSTTSVDKQETASAKITTDSVEEKVETDQKSDDSKTEKSEITPKRKSPRLQKKDKPDTNENQELMEENNVATDTNNASSKKLSDESFQLINNLNDQPVYKTTLNNSTSKVNSKKTTRNRTNSWTATDDSHHDVNIQNNIELLKNEVTIKKSESNNNFLQADNSNVEDVKNVSSEEKQRVSIDNKLSDKSLNENSNPEISLTKSKDLDNNENNELNETQKMLKLAPVAAVQSFIYYDDSDSDSKVKAAITDRPEVSEDQCVPVVPEINQKSIFNQNENDRGSYNDTCEPMDIDETIPDNVSITGNTDRKQEKDPLDKSEKNESTSPTPNKSKRESTSLSLSQNNEKEGNENKTTLILSQLKDVSATDNSLSKSPKTTVGFLSTSVNEVNKDKDTIKKDSHDYMTSTPLQQKNLKKLAMQINTSVIGSPNNSSTNTSVTKKNNPNDSKKFNKSSNDSSEESESENVSKEKSDFLDDEAEEASDDYESGDSRDDEERQYEKDHEIVVKGETLDSSDNASNDTDYEKDSFVVSSDEEDNELLSGSGDDLSMSDNELTQGKKSKKKFNDRKFKEQKKASREMFEARHNISNNSTKSDITKGKKNKRQRLNSSTLVSEEEIGVKSKMNNIMKLDSSQDSDPGDTVTDSKEAGNNVSLTEEHEITTVCNESVMNKKDPLSVKVKSEPQTPLKDINLSTVPIHDQIEEVEVDQNMSVMKPNETSDPLEEDSDASSISENMEITSNYDSVLKELNNVKEKKIKTLDISLNLNKKAKQNAKPPIVDNLNLTNTKKSNNKVKLANSDKEAKKQNEFDESSSDSIDLQLLFSEDSCDSEKKDQTKANHETESFIPLKRTEAKTNLLEDKTKEEMVQQKQTTDSMNHSNSDSLNISLNKKKKKNSMSINDDIASEKSNITLNTTNYEAVNSILDTSSKKKKKKKSSICNADGLNDEANSSNVQEKQNISLKEGTQDVITMNAPLTTSSKKKKKKNSLSVNDDLDHNNSINNTLNTSSKQKKNSISVSDETEAVNNVDSNISQNEISSNVSFNNTLNTSSKKKKSISVSEDNDKNTDTNSSLNTSSKNKNTSENKSIDTLNSESPMTESIKKKKKKNSISVTEDTNTTLNTSSKKNKISISVEDEPICSENKSFDDLNVTSMSESSKKKKKKNSISVSEGTDTNTALNTSTKKKNISISVEDETNSGIEVLNVQSNSIITESTKKKKKHNSSVAFDVTASEGIDNVEQSSNSSAKKKKKVKSVDLESTDKASRDDDSDAAPEEIPYASHKITSANELSGGESFFIDTEGNQDWNTLITGSSKKKDKKKKARETAPESYDTSKLESNGAETATLKKRKRKSSSNSQEVTTDPDLVNEPVNVENKKKKQKISQSEDTPIELKEATKKKSKKRKDRDDDDENKTSKVFKQNSSDKIKVPRLPPSILSQLEDKPKKERLEMKKAKVVSTSQFVVEEARKRKNKPSNYLEESVYLNDSVEDKKQKGFIKIPKVLPFVPTATISGSGFTTKFQINVLQKETKFVAQTSNLTGFKNDYLSGKKIKKVGTYELYKSQRNRKLSKF